MIVVIKDLYTLKSWEDQDTESLAFHLNNKKIWDNCRDGLPYHKWLKDFFEYIVLCSYKSSLWDSCP